MKYEVRPVSELFTQPEQDMWIYIKNKFTGKVETAFGSIKVRKDVYRIFVVFDAEGIYEFENTTETPALEIIGYSPLSKRPTLTKTEIEELCERNKEN